VILLAVASLGLAACFCWGFFPEWTEQRVDEFLARLER